MTGGDGWSVSQAGRKCQNLQWIAEHTAQVSFTSLNAVLKRDPPVLCACKHKQESSGIPKWLVNKALCCSTINPWIPLPVNTQS